MCLVYLQQCICPSLLSGGCMQRKKSNWMPFLLHLGLAASSILSNLILTITLRGRWHCTHYTVVDTEVWRRAIHVLHPGDTTQIQNTQLDLVSSVTSHQGAVFRSLVFRHDHTLEASGGTFKTTVIESYCPKLLTWLSCNEAFALVFLNV